MKAPIYWKRMNHYWLNYLPSGEWAVMDPSGGQFCVCFSFEEAELEMKKLNNKIHNVEDSNINELAQRDKKSQS